MMRAIGALALGGLLVLVATPARPCGAPFGPGMSTPAMNILVGYQAGVERYVFQPRFCGKAAQFGLILPIPATLTESPALAGTTLFAELEVIAAPIIEPRTECRSRGIMDAGVGGWGDASNGATVIDKGQVGIFDWVLLQAGSVLAFTDWLDTNGFPHDAAADPYFQYYVTGGWYFVAFKVTADSQAPGPDEQLCGDLGPIQLSFATAQPVVPARIAAAAGANSYYLNWTVFGLAAGQLGIVNGGYGAYDNKLRYSGALTTDQLAAAPALAALATAGNRLVKLDVGFFTGQVTDDMRLTEGTAQDYRDTVYDITYVDCDDGGVPGDAGLTDGPGTDGGDRGCAASSAAAAPALGLLLLALVVALHRRSRR